PLNRISGLWRVYLPLLKSNQEGVAGILYEAKIYLPLLNPNQEGVAGIFYGVKIYLPVLKSNQGGVAGMVLLHKPYLPLLIKRRAKSIERQKTRQKQLFLHILITSDTKRVD
ncbi:MAG: hypothetical protein O4965_12530, partial [Trichodesmium sp. St19_bin1]|nr:hypothetical protein [Trichodesmium sp. St19_bin1]